MSVELKVFILGSPRSGTSIMYYAMREVVRLKGRGESHVFPLFQRMIHQYYTHAMEMRKIQGVLAGDLNTQHFREALSAYLRDFYLNAYDVRSFVDKTPGAEAIRGCEFILETFPDARIILLQRNGIEVINSYRSKFNSSFQDACQSWRNVVNTCLDVLPSQPTVLTVDQFDLTNAPEASADRIALHLRRPELAAQLAKFFQDRRVDKHSSHDWRKRLTLSDVEWTEEQKQVFRQICGDSMAALHYPM